MQILVGSFWDPENSGCLNKKTKKLGTGLHSVAKGNPQNCLVFSQLLAEDIHSSSSYKVGPLLVVDGVK